jgi:hypothetical protein
VPPEALDAPVRFGFGFDAVGFSGRTAAGKVEVQYRLVHILRGVLADLGLTLADVDLQPEGDGGKVFLPEGVRPDRSLATLLRSWHARQVVDNAGNSDQLQVRLAAVIGPVSMGALNFSHNTPIELGRLLDSPPLRAAITGQPGPPVAMLISRTLHEFTVKQGHPDLTPNEFTQVDVVVKTYKEQAWLWVPPPPTDRTDGPAPIPGS